jgi:hypothetical protein
MRRFDATPRRATPKGQSFIFHAAAHRSRSPTYKPPLPLRAWHTHDLRLHGVQLQAQGPEPLGDGGPQLAGLVLGVAVRNNIIRITFERAARELPVHPGVERVASAIQR